MIKIKSQQNKLQRDGVFIFWGELHQSQSAMDIKNNTNTHPIQTSSVVISGTPVTQEDSMKCSRCPWETGGHTYDVYIQ